MPGPSCSTCAREDLADIHRSVDAIGLRPTAKAYGIKHPTLALHLQHRQTPPVKPAVVAKHPVAPIPPKPPVEPSQELQPVEPDLPLADIDGRILQLARSADRLRVAAEHGQLRDRGAALGQCRTTLAALVQLAAEREQGREPELLTSKAWAAVRGRLVETLRAFPDAARAVGETLRELEGA